MNSLYLIDALHATKQPLIFKVIWCWASAAFKMAERILVSFISSTSTGLVFLNTKYILSNRTLGVCYNGGHAQVQNTTGCHFSLLPGQKSMAVMFDSKQSSQIKNNKIHRWRVEFWQSITLRGWILLQILCLGHTILLSVSMYDSLSSTCYMNVALY